jgi:ferritin
MIKKAVQDALNKQIAKEMFSSNLYLAMAAYYHSVNLNGFANWMRIQAQEETMHSMKFFNYVIDRGGNALIAKLDAPKSTWKSPLDCFENVLEHEKSITESINKLVDVALKESDHATNIMLQWFVNEQVEEEATATDILERLRMVASNTSALFLLDSELKQRVFVPPATNT